MNGKRRAVSHSGIDSRHSFHFFPFAIKAEANAVAAIRGWSPTMEIIPGTPRGRASSPGRPFERSAGTPARLPQRETADRSVRAPLFAYRLPDTGLPFEESASGNQPLGDGKAPRSGPRPPLTGGKARERPGHSLEGAAPRWLWRGRSQGAGPSGAPWLPLCTYDRRSLGSLHWIWSFPTCPNFPSMGRFSPAKR